MSSFDEYNGKISEIRGAYKDLQVILEKTNYGNFS